MTGVEGDEQDQIVIYLPKIRPVRVPVQRPDGPTVLDFPNEPARQAFRAKCTTTVAGNCLQGARATCSLQAVDKCRGPGWLRWLGWRPRKPWAEVEACEEAAMQACLVSSEAACQQHAANFCEVVTRPPE